MNPLIFVPPLIEKLHEIDIKNSASIFTPTEDACLPAGIYNQRFHPDKYGTSCGKLKTIKYT